MNIKQRTGFESQFVYTIHQMLYGKDVYVSNKDVLLSFAKKNQLADESIPSLMVDYGIPLKKAKCVMRKYLRRVGLNFEEIRVESDKREVLFRYPQNTPSDLLSTY